MTLCPMQAEFIRCPICRNKTRVQIMDDTELKNSPLFCPKCMQVTLSRSQHPVSCMSLLRRSSFTQRPILIAKSTAGKRWISAAKAAGFWKCPKYLIASKNERNGIAEAIPFLSCLTMFSYREAPFGLRASFFVCRLLIGNRCKNYIQASILPSR